MIADVVKNESLEEKKKRAQRMQAVTVAALQEMLDEMPEDFILHVEPQRGEAEDG